MPELDYGGKNSTQPEGGSKKDSGKLLEQLELLTSSFTITGAIFFEEEKKGK